MENQLHSWRTQEFIHYEKGIGWYITLGIIEFLLISYQIYLHDYFAAITLALIGVAVYYFSRLLPREVTVTITTKGVNLDNTSYPYTHLKKFWIVEHDKAKHVTLETTAYLNRYIILPLYEENPEHISEILKKYLPESTPNQETLAQRLARYLKF